MTSKKNTQAGLEDVIDAVQSLLLEGDPTTEEFAATVDQLEKLYKIKTASREGRVNIEQLVGVAGNLLGIGMILGHERAHVIATKALGFVMKTRA